MGTADGRALRLETIIEPTDRHRLKFEGRHMCNVLQHRAVT